MEYIYNYIYEIKNLINNKTYIGQHKTNNLNDGYMGSGTVLKAAFKKYGKQNFQKTILEECTSETINELEMKWISSYKKQGKAEYNIAGGGQGCSNPFQFKSKEELQKIYNKMSKTRTGKPSGISGKRTKNNINYLIRGEHAKKFQPCKKSRKLICNETGEIFNSIRECCDILKIRHEDVSAMLNNKRTTPIGGYTFSEIKLQIPYVIILETEQTFETVKECANFLKCSKSTLVRTLSGKLSQCKGYHIIYYNNYKKENNNYFGLPRYNTKKQKSSNKNGHSVKCIETNEVFKSVIAASRFAGIAPSGISKCCLKQRNTAGGYHWCYNE